jgi:hypothetical protein
LEIAAESCYTSSSEFKVQWQLILESQGKNLRKVKVDGRWIEDSIGLGLLIEGAPILEEISIPFDLGVGLVPTDLVSKECSKYQDSCIQVSTSGLIWWMLIPNEAQT